MNHSNRFNEKISGLYLAGVLVFLCVGFAYSGDVYVATNGGLGDYSNTHYYPGNQELDPGSPEFQLLWSIPTNAIGRGCLFAVNDTIYVRGQYGNISCVKDGELIWRRNYNGNYVGHFSATNTSNSVTSDMCYYNGNLYYTERKIAGNVSTDTVFKTNAANGAIRAKRHCPGIAQFKRNGYYSAVAYDGYLYGFMNDTLWRLDTGFTSFSFIPLGYNFIFPSGIAIDTVYQKLYFVGYKLKSTSNDVMHRVDLATFTLDYKKEIAGCTRAWQFQSTVQIISPDTLLFANGNAHGCTKNNSRVFIINAKDGSVIKHVNPSGFQGARGGIVGPDFIGIVDRQHSVWLIKRSDFELFSASPVSATPDVGETCGSAIASNGFIFKIGDNQYLTASDIAGAKTGAAKKLFSYHVGSRNNCVMALTHNNKLYYHGGAGIIWCFGKKPK